MRILFETSQHVYFERENPINGRRYECRSLDGYHDRLLTRAEVMRTWRRWLLCYPEWAKKPALSGVPGRRSEVIK